MAKILVATVKPFAPVAINEMRKVVQEAGNELILLEKYKDQNELEDAVQDVDALIVRSDIIDREVIEAGGNLKIVVRAGAGYDNIDLEASTERDIVVMNTPGQNANAVAELAFGMMLYLIRNGFNGTAGTELRNKSLGIHGYGHIGRIITLIGQGFGMKGFAHDPYIDKIIIENDGVVRCSASEELYQKSQYISVNLPINKETDNLIGFDLLSQMPKSPVLVNTARKEIIDEEGLLKTFAERPDFRYAADIAPDCISEIETKYPGRFFFTPKKMGAQTAEANINAGIAAASQIVAFFKRGDTTYQVNK
jgi:D-3-phosphoglycerate dehydrogenase / 2-oxoglutarate reductase